MRKITIGMAHHSDFHGAYFSIQDIIKELRFNKREDLLDRLEFVVIENAKENQHAKKLLKTYKAEQDLVENLES